MTFLSKVYYGMNGLYQSGPRNYIHSPIKHTHKIDTAMLGTTAVFFGFSTVLMAWIAFSDVRYGMSFNLDSYGVSSNAILLQSYPWLATLLSSLSLLALIVNLHYLLININNDLANHRSKLLKMVAGITVCMIVFFGLTNRVTGLDKKIVSSVEVLSRMQTIKTHIAENILEGEVVLVTDTSVFVEDRNGEIVEIAIDSGFFGDEETTSAIEPGTRIAVYVDKNTSSPSEAPPNKATAKDEIEATSNKPVARKVTVTNPIVVNPVIPDSPTQTRSIEVSMRAYGRTGDEYIVVRHGDKEIKRFRLTKNFDFYTFNVDASISLNQLTFNYENDLRTSDAYDRNVFIDYVRFNGKEFQTEADNTYSLGHWFTGEGCSTGGYFKVVSLQCNGFFRYNDNSSIITQPTPTPTPTPTPEPTPEPTPTPTPPSNNTPSPTANSGHTPELVMSATRGPNTTGYCSDKVESGRDQILEINNKLAPVQGHFIFNIMNVKNSERWDGTTPHKFTSSGFNEAVSLFGARRIESTLMLGSSSRWQIEDLATGAQLRSDIKDWFDAYFDEADRWLTANPNVTWTVRLMHEMNGQWFKEFYIGPYPESVHADEYIKVWQRIYTLAENRMKNAKRVEWLWSPASWLWNRRGTELGPNQPNKGSSDPRYAYPGDQYVDYVGVSYYTTGTGLNYRSPSNPNIGISLVSQINNMRKITNKPFGIGEFGVGREVNRAAFWKDFFTVADDYNIEFINWFYVPCKADGDWTMLNVQTGQFDPQPGEVAAFREGYNRWMND